MNKPRVKCERAGTYPALFCLVMSLYARKQLVVSRQMNHHTGDVRSGCPQGRTCLAAEIDATLGRMRSPHDRTVTVDDDLVIAARATASGHHAAPDRSHGHFIHPLNLPLVYQPDSHKEFSSSNQNGRGMCAAAILIIVTYTLSALLPPPTDSFPNQDSYEKRIRQ